jgi:hypothetical protein
MEVNKSIVAEQKEMILRLQAKFTVTIPLIELREYHSQVGK